MASLDQLAYYDYYLWWYQQRHRYLPTVTSGEPQEFHRYPTPTPWSEPEPWPWTPAVAALVNAVEAQQLAATVAGPLRAQLERSAGASIAQVLDDYCGTPPRLIPWPYPGPPPWVFGIAAELNSIANRVESPAMQEGLLKVAGQVLERGFAVGVPAG